MDEQIRNTLLAALAACQGDELERVEFAFRGLPPDRMGRQYGESGETPQQILDSLRQHRARIVVAREWVENHE